MKEEINEIMYEHLKMLADAAENCMDEDLESITTAMVATAKFLIGDKDDKEE